MEDHFDPAVSDPSNPYTGNTSRTNCELSRIRALFSTPICYDPTNTNSQKAPEFLERANWLLIRYLNLSFSDGSNPRPERVLMHASDRTAIFKCSYWPGLFLQSESPESKDRTGKCMTLETVSIQEAEDSHSD